MLWSSSVMKGDSVMTSNVHFKSVCVETDSAGVSSQTESTWFNCMLKKTKVCSFDFICLL